MATDKVVADELPPDDEFDETDDLNPSPEEIESVLRSLYRDEGHRLVDYVKFIRSHWDLTGEPMETLSIAQDIDNDDVKSARNLAFIAVYHDIACIAKRGHIITALRHANAVPAEQENAGASPHPQNPK